MKDRRKLRIGLLAHQEIKNNQRNVILHLHSLLGEYYQFDVLTSSESPIPAELQGCSLHLVTVPKFNPGHLFYVSKCVSSYKRACSPDAIISLSHPYPLGFAMLLRGMFWNIPLILRMTGDPFIERELYGYGFRRARKYLMHEMIQPLVFRRADRILCVGKNIARKLVERGLSPHKTKVLHQPFSIGERSTPNLTERVRIREKYGMRTEFRLALFSGKLTEGKGADRLINITRHLKYQGSNVQIVVAGDGPLMPLLMRQDGTQILVLGNLSRTEMLEVFQAVDILIHPTRRDGLPTVILEAIAFGLPVIASPVGEIPHFVSHLVTSEQGFAVSMAGELPDRELIPDWFSRDVQKKQYLAAFKEFSEGFQEKGL